ncbi:MAG: hypothetical protein J3K34DRAFT_438144 [Monoraphidium minutum]|nr:MAG: hypothetical protein J3K34DRAFT_438144 [Monoraphidium minutum]
MALGACLLYKWESSGGQASQGTAQANISKSSREHGMQLRGCGAAPAARGTAACGAPGVGGGLHSCLEGCGTRPCLGSLGLLLWTAEKRERGCSIKSTTGRAWEAKGRTWMEKRERGDKGIKEWRHEGQAPTQVTGGCRIAALRCGGAGGAATRAARRGHALRGEKRAAGRAPRRRAPGRVEWARLKPSPCLGGFGEGTLPMLCACSRCVALIPAPCVVP